MNEPLRERARDRRTGHTHEILAREAEIVAADPFLGGVKTVVIRCMLTARVRVIPGHEFSTRFEPVDPAEPTPRRGSAISSVTVIAHIVEGEIIPTYHVVGEDVRLFVVDENHPGDRVFEWLSRSSESVIGEIIPEGSPIGNSQDQRHAALMNSIDAMLNGRPRFTVVPTEQS